VATFIATLTLTTTDTLTPVMSYTLTCSGIGTTIGSDPAVGSSISITSTVNNPANRTLTISNTGSTSLTINNLAITGQGASVFSTNPTITTSSPFTIPANSTKPIIITCTPTSVAAVIATLTLNTTDTLTPVMSYTLICTGTASTGLVYYPLPKPIRVLDTRAGQAALYSGGGTLTAGATKSYVLAGISYNGGITGSTAITIPAVAQVVVANLSAITPVGNGFLTFYPGPADISGTNRPLISSINYRDAAVTSNTSYLTMGTGGIVNVYSLRATDLVIDISGYYAPAGTVDPNGFSNGLVYYPLPKPIRVLDTRAGQAAFYSGGGTLTAGATKNYTLAGISYNGGITGSTAITIPAAARAVVANTTAVAPVGNGFLTLYPGPADASGTNRPTVSSMNYRNADVTTSGSYPTLDANGLVNIYSLRATDLVLDVSGYFAPIGTTDPNSSSITGMYYNPLAKPIRVLDTRAGQAALYNNPKFTAGQTQNYILSGISYNGGITGSTSITIPATARAVVANTTAVSPAGNGFLTIYPGPADTSGTNRPTVSSLNYRVAFTITSNPSHVTVSSLGVANIYSLQATDVIMDISGYYLP
jgi:hypothetical protein